MTEQQHAYLVIMPEGGLFGVYYDLTRARGAAKAIEGTMVALPVLEDYRPTGDHPAKGGQSDER